MLRTGQTKWAHTSVLCGKPRPLRRRRGCARLAWNCAHSTVCFSSPHREIKGTCFPSPLHLEQISSRFLADCWETFEDYGSLFAACFCPSLPGSCKPGKKAARVTDKQHLIPTDLYVRVSFPICVCAMSHRASAAKRRLNCTVRSYGIIVLINLLCSDNGNRIIKESLCSVSCSVSVQGSVLLYSNVIWFGYCIKSSGTEMVRETSWVALVSPRKLQSCLGFSGSTLCRLCLTMLWVSWQSMSGSVVCQWPKKRWYNNLCLC